jgi:hypothetical protein
LRSVAGFNLFIYFCAFLLVLFFVFWRHSLRQMQAEQKAAINAWDSLFVEVPGRRTMRAVENTPLMLSAGGGLQD